MDAPAAERVELSSNGIKLAGGLFVPRLGAPAPALLVCHGAGDFKEPYFELCAYLRDHGIAALALDMAGHGESGGPRYHVNIKQWVCDVRAGVDFLSSHPHVDARKVGAFGLSSGGTAVLEAALVEPRLSVLVTLDATVRNSLPLPLSLVLHSFVWLGRLKQRLTKRDLKVPLAKMGSLKLTSDPEVNRSIVENQKLMEPFYAFPFPGGADAFFVDTIKRVSKITVPTLVLWGEDDHVDPPESGRMLFAALTCKKQIHIISGNGHLGHLDRNRQQVFALTARWVLENLTAAARAAAA